MSQRIKISQVLKSQIPTYVREEYPLFEDFLHQYYTGQEYPGGPYDLIQNIDKYVKLDELTNCAESAILQGDIGFGDRTIRINPSTSYTGTNGFPDSYGLLKIDDEIITYTGKTRFSFTGCVRGFSGISGYRDQDKMGDLTFESTNISKHTSGATIHNLSSLFLKELLLKLKHQLLPGLENKKFDYSVDENIFIQNSRDFYSSKGTEVGFELLFKLLYGEKVEILTPKDFLFTPSNSNYETFDEVILEVISGNPDKLSLSTLCQDPYEDVIGEAFAPITGVEKIDDSDTGEIYYKAKLDSGLGSNRDSGLKSSIYGDFKVHPQTRVIGNIESGATTITVDSTIGFPEKGEIYVTYDNLSNGVVSYKTKSLNQFFGCRNVSSKILDATPVSINTFAYAKSGDDIIKVRIHSIPEKVEFTDDTYGYHKNLPVKFKHLGYYEEDFKNDNWIYNTSPSFDIKNIDVIAEFDNSYQIILKNSHNFAVNDQFEVISTTQEIVSGKITDIISEKVISVRCNSSLDSNYVKIKRNILKYDDDYITNVQNLYKHNEEEEYLIASSSIPSNLRENAKRKLYFSGNFQEGEEIFKISDINDHGFYTGDSVFYKPEVEVQRIEDSDASLDGFTVVERTLSSLFDPGQYFIKRISSTEVKFALSLSNIENSIFISLDSDKIVNNNTLEPYELREKSLDNQNLLRKLKNPEKISKKVETSPGFTGIMINGVEILNYKSFDCIKFGEIEKIDVLSPGFDFDVINPPDLTISDKSGTGAEAFLDVSGSLSELRIINPGFDYQESPIVTITGGNGSGASVSPNMVRSRHFEKFNSVGISTTDNEIVFSGYHKFKTGEQVVYITNDQQSVGGLSNGSNYFVESKDEYTISLYNTRDDSISGSNPVNLTALGVGDHIIEAIEKKFTVESFNILNSGQNYQNKRRAIRENNVNLQKNCIILQNHGYESEEIVEYVSSTGSTIGGLELNKEYYVKKLNDDEFKLSEVSESDDKQKNYNEGKYVNLSSKGSGISIFNYQKIRVDITSKVGISSIGGETFEVVVQPIFRGEISGVHVSSGGVGYGSSEIINYNRDPIVEFNFGVNAQAKTVVNNGEIVDVVILNQGSGYTSPPDLIIIGSGTGAVLTPIIENGFLRDINVISGGFGFTQETFVNIEPSGQDANLNPIVKSWSINLFEKNISNIEFDDTILSNGVDSSKGLQSSYIYAPRGLRETIHSIDSNGEKLYGKKDLRKSNNIEVSSINHSPIIGWAYDGNPIYGPYAYSKKDGRGSITQMKSGYKLNIKQGRPPTSIFPEGFFVEDYDYVNSSSEDILDPNNGRFCVTPDFPNGTYAYFATLNPTTVESSGPFVKYKKPEFPYLIGNFYQSSPIKFNFERNSNQNHFNFNKSWARNTKPYNLSNSGKNYDYLDVPSDNSQRLVIESIKPGELDSIIVKNPGDYYKVNDRVLFNDADSGGSNASGRVSHVKGKSVESIRFETVQVNNVEVSSLNQKDTYLITSNTPHDLENNDVINISGISSNFSLEGTYTASINPIDLRISEPIQDSSQTGIVTIFKVLGNNALSEVKENDIYQIDSEKVKVLNINKTQSYIRVLREFDGTSGDPHTIFSRLSEIPRRLKIKSKENHISKQNKEIYFNPVQSIGIGTISGIGIGTTISTDDGSLYIPTKSIYLKDHGLRTGDLVKYKTNSGTGIIVSEENVGIGFTLSNNQNLYIARISEDLIGISTVKVGIGSEGSFVGITSDSEASRTLFFNDIGTGVYHSFETTYDTSIGNISKNEIYIDTVENHELSEKDKIVLSVNPKESFTHIISYNDDTRRMILDKKSFDQGDVNTQMSSITISNHGLSTGDKIIYTSPNPSDGLLNNQIYYVVFVDSDTIKLSDTYNNSLSHKIVSILTSSSGEIGSVNPKLSIYKDSTLIFDVSDPSLSYLRQSVRYSAFELNFYLDKDYEMIWQESILNTSKVGRPGIDSDAKVTLSISDETPKFLYYRLDPIIENIPPESKLELFVDDELLDSSSIIVKDSNYNGIYNIEVLSEKSFKFNTKKIAESASYDPDISDINYATTSLTASGPISKIFVSNKGKNYRKLPKISSIDSNLGENAILEPFSSSIGKVNSVRISSVKKNYPSDETLRPTACLTQILKVDPLYTIDSISISSNGKPYLVAPKLIVKDSTRNEIIDDVDLNYDLENSSIEVLKNTTRLSNSEPIIIPTQNSNGVGISTISYNEATNDVTVSLNVQYSDTESFPVKVGDKFLIENVINKTSGRGFNSKDYNYTLFEAISTVENIGSSLYGSVTYNISDLIEIGDTIGQFDETRSFGKLVPESYFPVFSTTLRKSDFLTKETYKLHENIRGKDHSGTIEYWDSETGVMHISSSDDYEVGSSVKGISSKAEGIVTESIRISPYLPLDSSLSVKTSSKTESGFLNNNLQKIQDSDYYQKFSYSVRSRVDYDTWNDDVSPLAHTTGFKKFSDYQLESFVENPNSMIVGLSTGTFEQINNLIGKCNLNSVFDFDLASENNIDGASTKIVFNSKILGDYFESVGNRVLEIDNISEEFNSNPRADEFSEIAPFVFSERRFGKYLTYVKDKRFTQQRQLMVVDLLHDGSDAYMNQYARVETAYDLGSFDYAVFGDRGLLLFYPNKTEINNYDITAVSFNLDETLQSTGTGEIGGALLTTSTESIGEGETTTIFEIDDTYTSFKILVEIDPDPSENQEFEVTEMNIVKIGSDIHILESTKISTDPQVTSSVGFGTYRAYTEDSKIKIDFTPNQNITINSGVANSLVIALKDFSSTDNGFSDLKFGRVESKTTSIAASASPQPEVIAEYQSSDGYDAAYFIIQISDTTNNNVEFSEIILVDTYQEEVPTYDTYQTQYGIISNGENIGTISSRIIFDTSYKTQLIFTPIQNIDVHANVFMTAINISDESKTNLDAIDGLVSSFSGSYEGTHADIKKSFDMTHGGSPIFENIFSGEDSSVVDVSNHSINLQNHFFVTGESLTYNPNASGESNSVFESIEIEPTDFVGIGVTNRLPSNVFAIKVTNNVIKLASTPENALKGTPEFIRFANVGIGSDHKLTANNQNSKVLVTIDNVIQSPIFSTTLNKTSVRDILITDDKILVNDVSGLFGGELIQINDEVMLVDSIGVGTTNAVRVRRSQLGTGIYSHTSGADIKKVGGNYNIVDNKINFAEAPYGRVPIGSPTNDPEDRDWVGISTSSNFNGRVFLRSGIPNTSEETYNKNYVFDDISHQFNTINNQFTLKHDSSNVSDIPNPILLINDIFQYPDSINYSLDQNLGISTITFDDSGDNTISIPRGGSIISVGSSQGFGYQPLVTAGGSAEIASDGTIESISIGNTGSGYRSGIQTVNVSVYNDFNNIEVIGSANVLDGHVTDYVVTNPGSGYTSTTPPKIIVDAPLSYNNIPLVYSSTSSGSGIGTGAVADIIVGNDSKVIDFTLTNSGYGYEIGEVLTLPSGSSVGIPTTTGFQEFVITVDRTVTDKFSAWSVGELVLLDNIEKFIDGTRKIFPLTKSNISQSIISGEGSSVDVQNVLIVFVNNILQIPGEGYIFSGGSLITFTEPLELGDTVEILFYRGSGNIDVIKRNIIETVKRGDEVQIINDPSVGQDSHLKEDTRIAESVESTNIINTNAYFGPGNVSDEDLLRPVIWTKQTEDKIINDQEVSKDRELYEPSINPISYLINPVGVGQTIIYADTLRPAFDNISENDKDTSFQNEITLLSQTEVKTENCKVEQYSGDFGVVVGFAVTTDPHNRMIFDLQIPDDSIMRDESLVGTAVTVSQLSPGDYFTINSSLITPEPNLVPLISYDTNFNIVGMTTSFIDSTFFVEDAEIVSRNIDGVQTTLKRVSCRINRFDNATAPTVYTGDLVSSGYLGSFSWGKIILKERTKQNTYDPSSLNGYVGISSSTVIRRSIPLQYSNYLQ